MPFNQSQFNAEWLSMREALARGVKTKPQWAKNGLAYIKDIMAANDGSAEANILIALAEAKKAAKGNG